VTPDFYKKFVNEHAKDFKHLYLAVTEQPSGYKKERANFNVYCPENSLSAAKKVMKKWAEDLTREGTCVRIVSVVEIKEKNDKIYC